MAATPRPSLVTWDIDGTLLRTAPPFSNQAHKNAINEAVYAVHGTRITVDDVPHVGNTDLSIIRHMCTAANVPAPQIDTEMQNVLRHAEEVIKVDGDTSHFVLPGVQKVLSVLSEYRVPCALTTGNMAYIADLKLKSAGLRSFFVGGAFGDEREDRADILKLAVQRCAPGVNMDEVVHVGDAVSDVQAAKRSGARSIAVATGAYERRKLEAEKPDFIFDDLSDTQQFLKAVGLV
ncbi:Phosphoglycolate phosphatase [Gracilariopsis chorda]|uniref:Phosphoglycolate phosphatase n=1 Tax=Gracilariopsis chorda TaxID=448386 RepID=A0A2V3IV48_9FLOR|nr:Phosphoglycolate phosphatase [Gracilariopsis chorda]|eukprot:PXF46018.1 Phosphoglycolate phosphatase [Gracilariopsis chorda]